MLIIHAYHRQPGQTAHQDPRPRHGPRHQPGERRPLRLRGRAGRLQRQRGSSPPETVAARDGRRDRRHHGDQPQHPRPVRGEHPGRSREIVHAKGGLVYGDGANMNAVMGVVNIGRDRHRHPAPQPPQDLLHPPRRRRPGRRAGLRAQGTWSRSCRCRGCVDGRRGPTSCREDYPQSIGKLQAFWGNFGILVRAYSYILSLGAENLKRASRAGGPERQLHQGAAEGDVPPALRPALHARVRLFRQAPAGRTRSRPWTSPSASWITASIRPRSISRWWCTAPS